MDLVETTDGERGRRGTIKIEAIFLGWGVALERGRIARMLGRGHGRFDLIFFSRKDARFAEKNPRLLQCGEVLVSRNRDEGLWNLREWSEERESGVGGSDWRTMVCASAAAELVLLLAPEETMGADLFPLVAAAGRHLPEAIDPVAFLAGFAFSCLDREGFGGEEKLSGIAARFRERVIGTGPAGWTRFRLATSAARREIPRAVHRLVESVAERRWKSFAVLEEMI